MQFDVFVNPITAALRHYPYVSVLQSDLAEGGRERIAAPLVPRESVTGIAGRITPVVVIESAEFVVLVPALTGVRSRDLKLRIASLAAARAEILAAIDLLFFGA